MLTITHHFERHVQARPDAVAVVGSHARLTYRELDGLANALAARLIERGVAPGDRVIVHLARSVEAVVAFLAILKAGACYVPLDPGYPIAVRTSYLEGCGARHVILRRADLEIDPAHRCAKLFADDLLDADVAGIDRVRVAQHPDAAAYLMFTSGSTGRPKGVVIAQRGIVRLVCDTNYIRVAPDDVFLLLSTLSFDASTFEIWGALLNGAQLVVYDQPAFDPNLLAALVTRHRVSVLWLTAALFHLMARHYVQVFQGLRVLLAGGDVVHATAVNAVLDAHPALTVINGYGPTENTTFTCCHVMTRANRPDGDVPVGLPISGTDVHVLDARMQPVADGEIGELYASGLGVALGYLEDHPQSSGAFLNDPVDGAPMYRTGDMVRRCASGVIAYVGRRDRVAKVRGFRVSLDEVQAAIMRVAGVEDCSVDLAHAPDGDKRLVAVIQADDRGHDLGARIKARLRETVPAFMVPDTLEIRRQLPMTSNGKVDRKVLLNELSAANE